MKMRLKGVHGTSGIPGERTGADSGGAGYRLYRLGILYESYKFIDYHLSTLPSAGVLAPFGPDRSGNDFSLIALIGIVLPHRHREEEPIM